MTGKAKKPPTGPLADIARKYREAKGVPSTDAGNGRPQKSRAWNASQSKVVHQHAGVQQAEVPAGQPEGELSDTQLEDEEPQASSPSTGSSAPGARSPDPAAEEPQPVPPLPPGTPKPLKLDVDGWRAVFKTDLTTPLLLGVHHLYHRNYVGSPPQQRIMDFLIAYYTEYPGKCMTPTILEGLIANFTTAAKRQSKGDAEPKAINQEFRAIMLTDAPNPEWIRDNFVAALKDRMFAAWLTAGAQVHDGTNHHYTRADIAAGILAVEQLGATPTTQEGAMTVSLADVAMQRIHWLWPGRIPLGKVALLIGDPDLGKSNLSVNIGAHVTAKRTWPDGTPVTRGRVLMLTAEDDLADTVKPRLIAMGGNPALVVALTAVRIRNPKTRALDERVFSIEQDLALLEAELIKSPDIRLITIDPVSAYFGTKDSYKDTEVRRVLAPLAALAAKYHVAILGIMHLTKNRDRKAIQRAIGSIAFMANARAGFVVVTDDTDPKQRLFLPVKMNLAAKPDGLRFRLEKTILDGGIETSKVLWIPGAVNVDVDDVLQTILTPAQRHAQQDAAQFLQTILADDPLGSEAIKHKAAEAGIDWKAVREAKDRLGITTHPDGKQGAWLWWLPGTYQPERAS